jgi:hypothetical protein
VNDVTGDPFVWDAGWWGRDLLSGQKELARTGGPGRSWSTPGASGGTTAPPGPRSPRGGRGRAPCCRVMPHRSSHALAALFPVIAAIAAPPHWTWAQHRAGRRGWSPSEARGRERSDVDSPRAGATIIQVQWGGRPERVWPPGPQVSVPTPAPPEHPLRSFRSYVARASHRDDSAPRRSHVNDVNPQQPWHVHRPPAHKATRRSRAPGMPDERNATFPITRTKSTARSHPRLAASTPGLSLRRRKDGRLRPWGLVRSRPASRWRVEGEAPLGFSAGGFPAAGGVTVSVLPAPRRCWARATRRRYVSLGDGAAVVLPSVIIRS